ncbi:MAG: hypothetical protein HRT44_04360 [Bdellovibrionales bacterium]|nr:hypothetical protein [Bdellovibrionales bacterium]NQZ18477.1 hypothetical protein [Bdellovibrionales bacterium]
MKQRPYYNGDDQYSEKDWFYDDQIFIPATPQDIWPWIVQMGNNRAGWYSYDWLDNLGQKSFEYIDPNLQKVELGQKIAVFTVQDFKKDEYLTLKFSEICNMTWILKKDIDGTQLITRLRVKGPKWLLGLTLGPGHLFMQKKQFKEIKNRVLTRLKSEAQSD